MDASDGLEIGVDVVGDKGGRMKNRCISKIFKLKMNLGDFLQVHTSKAVEQTSSCSAVEERALPRSPSHNPAALFLYKQ